MEVTRADIDNLLARFERKQEGDRDEILAAIRDLKQSMNGQFTRNGDAINRHEAAIAVLQDRGSRDVPARWGAAVGAFIAAVATVIGIK